MITKNFLNRASWIILILLFIPAGAVQASKDAIPGDSIYPIKLVLEDALLFMMKPSQAATSDMEVRFTKRRLLEVEQVVDTVFVVESLKNLNEQVTDTAISIGKVKNLTKQSELANKYIQTLQETQASLERQRLSARAAHSGSSSINADEIRRQIEQTKADIAAEIEMLRRVALANERIKQQQILENERARQAAEQAAQQAQQDAQAAQAAQAAAEAAQAAAEAEAAAAEAAQAAAEAEAQEAEDDEQSNDNQGQEGQGNNGNNGNNGNDGNAD